VHQTIFYQIIKIIKVFFLVHEVLNFLKNHRKMFKYYKRLDDVLMFEEQYLICWIVPKTYLLLLDQTILLHFRSNIDRPLNLPQYTFSITSSFFKVLSKAKDKYPDFKYIEMLNSQLQSFQLKFTERLENRHSFWIKLFYFILEVTSIDH
jgi:Leu/Phe-tRNA-protein transferase